MENQRKGRCNMKCKLGLCSLRSRDICEVGCRYSFVGEGYLQARRCLENLVPSTSSRLSRANLICFWAKVLPGWGNKKGVP